MGVSLPLFFSSNATSLVPIHVPQQASVFMKTSFMTSFVFVFRRCLQNVFKTSWSRRIYLPQSYVFKTTSRRLDQGGYIRLGHMFWRRLEDIFRTSCENVFKTSSTRLEDFLIMSWTFLQDIFNAPRRLFKKYSRRF